MRRHFGKRKRSWGGAFRPLDARPSPPLASGDKDPPESSGPVILKPIPQHLIPRNGFASKALAGLDASTDASDVLCSEASRLTSEVAFWLRHLKPAMTRSLTSSKEEPGPTFEPVPSSRPDNEANAGIEDEDSDDDCAPKWSGVESVMVLYMGHQQGNCFSTPS